MFKYVFLPALVALSSCDVNVTPTANQREHQLQETLSKESVAQVGVPAIKNFREKKLLKDIFELRDQDGLVTYTYTFSEVTGKFSFFCNSIGYGIPYATQFTNPLQPIWSDGYHGYSGVTIAQADPNGLFSPASADGTWILCLNPETKKTEPQYVEPKITVLTYKMPGSGSATPGVQ